MNYKALDYTRYFWQGDKVRLRPLRAEDAEQLFVNTLDSPARQFLQLRIELPTSVELLRATVEKYAGCKDVDGLIVFAVDNIEGEYVGGLSFHSRDPKNGTFGFGVLIHPEHRNKGYAADAVRILLRYCFWERRYHKCNSACVHTNEASIQMHRRLGFVEEGRRRESLFFNGQYHDDILFGLTREEFDAQGKRP
jgi:RimJ/RimL family protein N-acetyltransferase